MRSPRFHLRDLELRGIFEPSNLKRIWRDKVRLSMRSSHIQDPIESFDFHINLSAHCLRLEKLVREAGYRPTSGHRILIEKSKGLCRQIVIPSIDDAIILQALSDALYLDIKGKAPTSKSFFEPEDHHFSNALRDEKGAPRYGSFRAWLNFQRALLNFTRNRNFVVITDIANYYDFISYAHVRNIIASLTDVRESVLDMLIFALS